MSLLKNTFTEIGNTFEKLKDATIEWQIPDFFSLSDEADTAYRSPIFSFSDSFWQLLMYSNGETKKLSSGYVGLYLLRLDSGPPKIVSFDFSIKGAEVTDERCLQESRPMHCEGGCGRPKFFSRTLLKNRMPKLMPSNILIVVCNLKSNNPCASKTSLYNRYRNVCRSMKAILNDGQMSDFKLVLNGRVWNVHKVIRGSRCEYFATMFRHQWKESEEGEVEFRDVEEEAFDIVLRFIYTGEVEEISAKNACKIFVAADRFLLGELKELCIEYMKENMSLDSVVGAIAIANDHNEKELGEHAKKYFIPNAKQVFASEEYKVFKKENEKFVTDYLENIIVERMKMI